MAAEALADFKMAEVVAEIRDVEMQDAEKDAAPEPAKEPEQDKVEKFLKEHGIKSRVGEILRGTCWTCNEKVDFMASEVELAHNDKTILYLGLCPRSHPPKPLKPYIKKKTLRHKEYLDESKKKFKIRKEVIYVEKIPRGFVSAIYSVKKEQQKQDC